MGNRRAASYAATGIVIACCPAARAQSTVSLETAAQVRHDTNLLRRADDAPAQAGGAPCKADDIARLQARLAGSFDAGAWSGSVVGGPYRELYRCNKYLNFSGYEAFASVERKTADPVTVRFNAIALRQRSSFADTRNEAGNIQNFVRLTGEVGLAVTPELRIVFDPRFVASTNSNTVFRAVDYHSYGGAAGLGWFTPLDNSIVLKVSRIITKGLQPRIVRIGGAGLNSPIDLADTTASAELVYHPSVLTTLEGTLNYVRRRDASLLRENDSGITGSVRLRYSPYELLVVTAEAGRRLTSDDVLFIDSVRDEYFNLAVERSLGRSTKLSAKFDYDRRRFRFDPTQQTAGPESFTRMSVDLAAEALVFDTIMARGAVRREWSQGTVSYPRYHATIASLELSYKFGSRR